MAVVSPVRDQEASGAVLERGASTGSQVVEGVGQPPPETAPRAGSGTYMKVESGGRDSLALPIEGVVGFIAPDHGNGIAGNSGEELGML